MARKKGAKKNKNAKLGTKDFQSKVKIGRRKQGNASLRERMLGQLKSSRFRYINEEIYSMPGRDALNYFKKEPEAFEAYHSGYQKQLQQWPSNPIDTIVSAIKRNFKKTSVIADLGCGSASLSKSLPEWTTHSFDLVALDPCVRVCDMASTPLPSSSVDIVVFSLSLMGTNLGDYFKEANRILKIGGTMKIAEVASRFEDVQTFIKDLSSYGFKNYWNNLTDKIFFFFDFRKERDLGKKSKKKLPKMSLKACVYKKR